MCSLLVFHGWQASPILWYALYGAYLWILRTGNEKRMTTGVSCVSCLSCVSGISLIFIVPFLKVKEIKGIQKMTMCVSCVSCLSCVCFKKFFHFLNHGTGYVPTD